MEIGGLSGSFFNIHTQVSDNNLQRLGKTQDSCPDTFKHDENSQFAKDNQFYKTGRLFQNCSYKPSSALSTSASVAIQGEPVSMFEGRNGYDKNFLGVELPLPGLGSSIKDKVAMRTDKPGECELTYTNYSVVMNKERKQCFYAICNIDGRASRAVKREGTWTLDGRIPRKYQLGDEAYGGNNIDRGHMVRRLDPCWGSNAKLAGEDTFSYCNSALQHGGLNKKEWLRLEDHVLNSARGSGQKITVITGPIFAADDPKFNNKGAMKEEVQIPLQFFKTVIWNEKGSLKSASFILSQKDIIEGDSSLFKAKKNKGKGFDPGEFKVYQVPQKEVERLTDLHFGNIGDITEKTMLLMADNNFAPHGLS
ncbi:MAG: DNA/RNA non-specific endonuclease [Candidatus Bruticola sp.]